MLTCKKSRDLHSYVCKNTQKTRSEDMLLELGELLSSSNNKLSAEVIAGEKLYTASDSAERAGFFIYN